MTDTSARQDWIDGISVMLPLIPGVLPFGMIAGVAASETGLDALAGIGQSMIVFAGASQIAALQLISDAAPALVVILTGLVINLRFAMYGASLAPHFEPRSVWMRALIAHLMTDQSYALSVTRFNTRPEMTKAARLRFYMGNAGLMWIVWAGATAAGYFLGNSIPPDWSMDFFVPLSFIALLVPSIRECPMAAAALTGGVVVALAWTLPFNMGLFAAAVCGVAAGYLADRLFSPPRKEPN